MTRPADEAMDAEAAPLLAWLREARPPLERLRTCWESRRPELWRRTPELYAAIAPLMIGAGEPFLAHDVTAEGLDAFPSHLRLQQLRALALAQTGATATARGILEAMVAAGHEDPETVSLLARTHKDLWRAATSKAEARRHLKEAFEQYHRAFRQSRDYYPGVNAASLACLAGRGAEARRLAEEVRRLAMDRIAAGESSHWLEATLGEVALILGDLREAADRYLRMAQKGRHDMAALCSARRQSRLLLAHLGEDPYRLDACFGVAPILVFTATPGRREGLDAPVALAEYGRLKAELSAELDASGGRLGFASADSIADLAFLELLLERDGEVHMVLPFPAEVVREDVAGHGAERDWGRVFDRVLAAAASVTVASPGERQRSPIALEYAEKMLLGLARLKAQTLDADFRFLWLDAGQVVRAAPMIPVETVEVKRVRPPRRAVQAPPRAIRGLLFADVVGYSRLTETEIPVFLRFFLRAVGRLVEDSADAPSMRMTWGDALYLGFETVGAAGRFALELRDLVGRTRWRDLGLSTDLRVRIGLHAGPVYVHHDPVIDRPSFAGSHVTQTARIEPIAEEGQIYASESFAALAAAEAGLGFAIDYVGERSMAKEYGRMRVYLVRPRRQRPVETGAGGRIGRKAASV